MEFGWSGMGATKKKKKISEEQRMRTVAIGATRKPSEPEMEYLFNKLKRKCLI